MHVVMTWGRRRAVGANETVCAATLQARYIDAVYRYVARRVAPPVAEAEDVTAEVFAAAFAALPKMPRDVDPRLWLLGIARRKVADTLRKRGRRNETHLDDSTALFAPESDGPEASLMRDEARRTVRRLVLALPEAQREALLLQNVDGFSVAEIATVLGKSPIAVQSLLARARTTLYRTGAPYFVDQNEENER